MTPEQKAKRIAGLAALLMRGVFRTLRFRVADRAGVLRTPPERPLLWAFWHNRLFVMASVFERYFPGRLGAALISQSKDGAIIAAIIEKFGIEAIRGSSSRGGARSLIQMKRALEDGYIVAITPDGPRGPRYSITPGLLKLAQFTHGVIMPIHVNYSSFWSLKKSWDGFMIPKPFSTVDITFDVLHEVPETADEREFEYQRVKLENLLRPQHGD